MMKFGGHNTRIQILKAAESAFAKNGYHKTKLTDISRIAKISKPAIYIYFQSKESLFLETIEKGLNEILDYLKEMNKDDKRSGRPIDLLIKNYVRYLTRNADIFKILMLERCLPTIWTDRRWRDRLDLLHSRIIHWIAKEIIGPTTLPDHLKSLKTLEITRYILAIVHNMLQNRLINENKGIASKEVSDMLRFLNASV